MKHNKDIRIAVIGGGPGGLGACEALRDKGYQNITLFESLSRVGGKSLSLTYKTPSGDEIIYECGSFVPLSSKNLHRLIKKNDLHLGKQIFGKNNPNVRIFIKVFSLTKKKPLLDFTKYRLGYPLSLKNFYHKVAK